jgi:ABC-type branched-subunit amino acid transport system permease subunit
MDYLQHILVMVAFYAILAASFNLLIGFAGLFALSQAAFFGVGAYTTAILATRLGLPFPLPIVAGVLLTAAVGMLVALPASSTMVSYACRAEPMSGVGLSASA